MLQSIEVRLRPELDDCVGQRLTNGIRAALGFAVLDVLGAQVAGQVAGADDFNAVTKHQDANGGAVKVIAVHQGVDQQLFQCDGRHFQLAQGVKAPAVLHVVQVALDPMRGKPCRSGQGQERGRQSRPGGLDWF